MKKLLIISLAIGLTSVYAKTNKSTKIAKPINTTDETVINDAWYTMQAGSAPWGYFHEIIEKRDGRYGYRYSMTKFERGTTLQENIGALAKDDLTPITFNLNKSGAGATETTNATYVPTSDNPYMNVQVSGARSTTFKRYIAKGTILDVFLPVYLQKNWSKLQPGYKTNLPTFAEDPDQADFRSRSIHLVVKEMDTTKGCLNIEIEMEDLKTKWCVTSGGSLVELSMKGYHVRKVSGEAEAKSFLSGVLPKAKDSK